MLSAFLLSCSGVTKNDDGTVTTTYGFNLVDLQNEFGAPDSIRVWVVKGTDTLSNTRYTAQDLDGTKLFFDITVAENAQVQVSYVVYAGGEAVGANAQTFVSGETPTVPRPALKSMANAGKDTLVDRGAEIKFAGSVDKRAELAKGYAWDYDGDGRFDDEYEGNKGFVKTYNDTGSYAAVFRVTGSYGLYDDDTVQVRVQNPLPVIVSLSAPGRTTAGTEAELEVKASSKYGSIVNYEWDLGADGTWDSTGKSMDALTVRMGAVGDWKVKVRVTDNEGRSVEALDTVEVTATSGNLPPEISLLFQTDSVVSEKDAVGWRVDFSDGNTRADVVKFEWDLDGDGTYEIVKTEPDSLAHTYNTPGSYTIRVKITDAGGESASKSQTLRVVQGVPTASLAISKTSAGIAESLTFTATASDLNETAPDGLIAKYEWDFDSDGTYDKMTTSGSTTFAYPDAYKSHEYTAQVRVTDDDGNTAAATTRVTVANRAPNFSNIVVSATPVMTNDKVLLRVVNAGTVDLDGNLPSLAWDVDGDDVFELVGESEYKAQDFFQAAPGTYIVRVKGCDGYGLCDTVALAIDVLLGVRDQRDGAVYSAVSYNYEGSNHVWMKENLNYSGDDGLGHKAFTTGWCYGVGGNSDTTKHQDSVTCDNGYGRLYRWNEAMGFPELKCNSTAVAASNAECSHTLAIEHQGLCPSGWHVPNDAEWTAFTAFVEAQDGVANNAGAWLKAVVAANTSWNNADYNLDDPLGFSALPAGYRIYDGYWDMRGYQVRYWSSREYNESVAYSCGLFSSNATIYSGDVKSNINSIRCLQDTP